MVSNLLRRLRRNWQIKLYMLILAIVLWLFVVSGQQYETALEVPLDIVDMKVNKVLVSDVPSAVSVRFAGSGKDLMILRWLQSPRMELDIHTINYFYDYPLQTEYVVVPPGVEATPLYIIGPDTVYVRLEDELVRRLPVSPHLDVKPQPGYLVAGPVQTQPESVVVSGPRSEVERLDSVRTVEKVMIGLAENRTEEVDLVNPTEKTQVSPRRVRATIRIDKLGERSLTRVPLVAENVPEGRSVLLEPSAINVRVRGPSTRLASLTPDSLLGVVDLADWEPGVRDYRPRMQSPADVEIVELSPDRVRVRMERLEGEE